MRKITFEKYQQAILDQYEMAKTGSNSDFLEQPTPKSLRELCALLYEKKRNAADEEICRAFFGFTGSDDGVQKINKFDIDKFRPIQRLFLGTTSKLNSIASLNLAALLADYEPRPFLKFRETYTSKPDENGTETENPKFSVSDEGKMKEEIIGLQTSWNAKTALPENAGSPSETTENPELEITKGIGFYNANQSSGPSTKRSGILSVLKTAAAKSNWLVSAAVILIVFASIAYSVGSICFPPENCMVWKRDHYEAVNCSNYVKSRNEPEPKQRNDSLLLRMQKLDDPKNITFFKNGTPIVWYSKQNNTYDFFTYPGRHPETGKPLHPVSTYIASKFTEKK